MDTVVIVLLVLAVIVIILAAKGKPLWNNWAKPLWSFLKRFYNEHPDASAWILIILFLAVSMFYGIL